MRIQNEKVNNMLAEDFNLKPNEAQNLIQKLKII